ncbi:hypothetical protein V8D89_000369 [Ganoderma adspersum]
MLGRPILASRDARYRYQTIEQYVAIFLRFDADGAARLSTSLSLGSAIGGSLGLGAFSDIGASDVGSNSGEAMLPPPYANYLPGGARIEEE